MAFEQNDEKQAGNFWPRQEEANVQIDAPTAMGQTSAGISARFEADAAFANMTPQQAEIAQRELETAQLAISRGDYDAVARMQFTEPGTRALAEKQVADARETQVIQQNAMGALAGVATGGLFGGFFSDEDKMKDTADVGTGIAMGSALPFAAGLPGAVHGVKSMVAHNDDGRTLADLSFLQTPNVPNVRSASVEKDVGSYTRAPRT